MDEIAEAAVGLFMALTDGAVVLDVLEDRDDVRIVAANQAMAAGFGGPATLRGRLGSELYPPAELADVVRRARDTLAAGVPTSYEAVRELPQGRLVIAASIVPIGPSRVISYGRDVSERVEATRRLEQLEVLADIGSWQWNLHDRTLHWSRQYRRILGVSDDENPTIERVMELIHPDDRERVRGRAEITSAGQDQPGGATYRIVRPDGEERVVEGRGELVSDDQGRPLRMFGTIQDVTESHRADEDRGRLQQALHRQKQALELNDNVVQGLAAAWLAFDLGQVEEGIGLVQRTTRDAQNLVNALLHEAAENEPLAPGDLARRVPANVDHPEAG
ncbi:MAG TPA: PAS domain S-box protein [Egicoccus sp.]|nr:PAS domain S-box protein [Egicoccus sp.]HSK23615.1 PAS domain S-box protein [Egicoccus sp.]